MGGCFAFWLLCACDKKKFVHTFGLIRRRRRRRRRRVSSKKKSNQKRDRSNVKCQRQKRKKGREKPIIKPKNKKKFETQNSRQS